MRPDRTAGRGQVLVVFALGLTGLLAAAGTNILQYPEAVIGLGTVVLAMGLSMPEAVGGLRLTVSSATTDAQIDRVLEVLPGVVKALRGQAVGAR